MKIKLKELKSKKVIYIIIGILILITLIVGIYNHVKPLPERISVEGEIYSVLDEDIEFLYDLTYIDNFGEKQTEQQIFDRMFEIVDGAERFIAIDVFLFNTDYSEGVKFRNVTTDLKDKLIEKKKINPDIKINFITDEINNFYGSYTSDVLAEMERGGINVIITDSRKLRDSNPLYSAFWRTYIQWFGTYGGGWIKHPLGNTENNVTVRSILKVLNAKANHRKVIVADSGDKMVSLIASANPHEASSKHSNVAIYLEKGIWRDIVKAEKAIAEFSEEDFEEVNFDFVDENLGGDVQIQLLTEGKIRDNLIKEINLTEAGDEIKIMMFYFSDRKIIKSLLAASERGVNIELVLDPNKDAFAREKNGVPARPVAYELIKESGGEIKIRWFNTQGEQFHSKLVMIKRDGKVIVFLGSANLTKRNIGDFNLEMDVKVVSAKDSEFVEGVEILFERIWNNVDGKYTLDFESYEDDSFLRKWQYRFQEFSGVGTF